MARHTFATTIALEKGVDIKTVSKLLGQSSIKSTEIYAKVSSKKLIDTAKSLDKVLEVAISGTFEISGSFLEHFRTLIAPNVI